MCEYKSLLVACTYLNSTHPRPHHVVYELLGLAAAVATLFSLQTDGDLSLNAQTAGSSNIQKITITERDLCVSHVYLLAGEDVLEIVETANKNLLVLKSRQNPTRAVLFFGIQDHPCKKKLNKEHFSFTRGAPRLLLSLLLRGNSELLTTIFTTWCEEALQLLKHSI